MFSPKFTRLESFLRICWHSSVCMVQLLRANDSFIHLWARLDLPHGSVLRAPHFGLDLLWGGLHPFFAENAAANLLQFLRKFLKVPGTSRNVNQTLSIIQAFYVSPAISTQSTFLWDLFASLWWPGHHNRWTARSQWEPNVKRLSQGHSNALTVQSNHRISEMRLVLLFKIQL